MRLTIQPDSFIGIGILSARGRVKILKSSLLLFGLFITGTAAAQTTDFGDMPDTYGTLLASDGARHTFTDAFGLNMVPGANGDADRRFGLTWTGDADAAPSVDANTDQDDALPRNELNFTTGISSAVNVVVVNEANTPATVYGWMDWEGDGIVDVFVTQAVAAGFDNSGPAEQFVIDFGDVPDPGAGNAFVGYLRLRITSDTLTQADIDGLASDGEVEDYLVQVDPALSTCPASGRQTLLDWSNSPTVWDTAWDGTELPRTVTVNGVDYTYSFAENGTVEYRNTSASPGVTGGNFELDVDVTALATAVSVTMTIDIWQTGTGQTVRQPQNNVGLTFRNIDVRDGGLPTDATADWQDNITVTGMNGAATVQPQARSGGSLYTDGATIGANNFDSLEAFSPTGDESAGFFYFDQPVDQILITYTFEDGNMNVQADPSASQRVLLEDIYQCSTLDYGDAPIDYDDTNGNGAYDFNDSPASHSIVPGGVLLGSAIDAEAVSNFSSPADGDDVDGSDDEDGVSLPATLVPGSSYNVPVTASSSGFLSAWFDWNGDGDFNDSGEQVSNNQSVSSGATNLSITVPYTAATGATYARFRICASSNDCNTPTGAASSGEVEDHIVSIAVSGCFPTITDTGSDWTINNYRTYTAMNNADTGSSATDSGWIADVTNAGYAITTVTDWPVAMSPQRAKGLAFTRTETDYTVTVTATHDDANGGVFATTDNAFISSAAGNSLGVRPGDPDTDVDSNYDIEVVIDFTTPTVAAGLDVNDLFDTGDIGGGGTSSPSQVQISFDGVQLAYTDLAAPFAVDTTGSRDLIKGDDASTTITYTFGHASELFVGAVNPTGISRIRIFYKVSGVPPDSAGSESWAIDNLRFVQAFCVDQGDAPDTYDDTSGGGFVDADDEQARHTIVPGLNIGATVDDEQSPQHSVSADGDDASGDDEDGVSNFTIVRTLSSGEYGVSYTVAATNNTGSAAQLICWIDWDQNGVFDNTTEISNSNVLSNTACVTGDANYLDDDNTTGNIPTGCSATVTVFWTGLSSPAPAATTDVYSRCRITTDSSFLSTGSPSATGSVSNGEVEDNVDQAPPTAVTIGKVELEAVSVTDFLATLGVDDLNDAQLLNLLSGFDSEAAASLPDADRAEVFQALLDHLDPNGDRKLAIFRWKTLEERGTVGFFVYRRSNKFGETLINNDMLPGLITAPMGGEYMLADPGAVSGEVYQYRLVEQEANGNTREYGPFTLEMP